MEKISNNILQKCKKYYFCEKYLLFISRTLNRKWYEKVIKPIRFRNNHLKSLIMKEFYHNIYNTMAFQTGSDCIHIRIDNSHLMLDYFDSSDFPSSFLIYEDDMVFLYFSSRISLNNFIKDRNIKLT